MFGKTSKTLTGYGCYEYYNYKDLHIRAVVVAQLVERLLPTPEIRGPNPNIGKVLSTNCNKIEKTKLIKEAGNGPSLKKEIIDSVT